jgi:hypothetical protein
MATSTNYGWAEPDNSSLVKNGASDIRTLGNAIDTSLWNSGFGQAAKNKLINGDFSINQRNFTSSTTNGAYSFDRWYQINAGGTVTVTPQTFTPGAAPVAGYEKANYLRCVVASQSASTDLAVVTQKIEDVRTFAGQTVTVSFWAKAASGTPKIGLENVQDYGQGGSPSSATLTALGTVTLSTSWARYSLSFTMPSITGKTLGTTPNTSFTQISLWLSSGATYAARSSSIGIQNNTFDISMVQLEYGSVATPFQTATATIQEELSACQRYYFRYGSDATYLYAGFGSGSAASTTQATIIIQHPVSMRTSPTAAEFSTIGLVDGVNAIVSVTSVTLAQLNQFQSTILANTASGLTQYRWYRLSTNNSSSGYFGLSAEL